MGEIRSRDSRSCAQRGARLVGDVRHRRGSGVSLRFCSSADAWTSCHRQLPFESFTAFQRAFDCCQATGKKEFLQNQNLSEFLQNNILRNPPKQICQKLSKAKSTIFFLFLVLAPGELFLGFLEEICVLVESH